MTPEFLEKHLTTIAGMYGQQVIEAMDLYDILDAAVETEDDYFRYKLTASEQLDEIARLNLTEEEVLAKENE